MAANDAALTNVVLTYHAVPSALVGDAAFLPSLSLNINQFLAFQLHALCLPDDKKTFAATLKWATSLPDVPTLDLKVARSFRTLPPSSQLSNFLLSPKPPGTLSVSVNGLCYPLELADVWVAWLRVKTLRRKWQSARSWAKDAREKEGPMHRGVFSDVLDMFNVLKWTEGLRGFRDREITSVASLTRFLSDSAWLATSDLEHLGELTQISINQQMERAQVVSPDWVRSIQNLRSLPLASPNAYMTHVGGAKSLRRQGHLLVHGDLHCQAGIANIGGVHWISFIIHSPSHRILIGDSMNYDGAAGLKSAAHRKITETIQWWLNCSYNLADMKMVAYDVVPLHGSVQKDSSSCGLFAQNSLDSYFITTQYRPLLPASMSRPRAEFFLRLANHHVASSSVSCTAGPCHSTIELTSSF